MTAFDAAQYQWPALVPELNVLNLAASLHFWRDLLGFRVLYDRPENGFAYLEREGAAVMLDQVSADSWSVGALEKPLGRGLNLQIGAASLSPILERLAAAHWPLYLPPFERWYRTGDKESGQRQFLVQDPDGYLLRFAEALGERG